MDVTRFDCDCYVCLRHERTFQTLKWVVLFALPCGVLYALLEWWGL
jgi:hypothetical protein